MNHRRLSLLVFTLLSLIFPGTGFTVMDNNSLPFGGVDLAFSDSVTYDGNQNYFNVTVCGTRITDTSQVGLRFEANGFSKMVKFTPKTGCQTVASGDLKGSYDIKKSGNYTVKATLDLRNAYKEVDDTNNTILGKVMVPANYYNYDSKNLPDLSVSNVSFRLNSNAMEPEICLVGTLNTYASESVFVSYTVQLLEDFFETKDGKEELLQKAFTVTGEEEESTIFDSSDACTTVVLRTTYWGVNIGENMDLLVTVTVDSKNTTPETSESNNIYTGTVNTGYFQMALKYQVFEEVWFINSEDRCR